jgi:5-methylcytosine-specific restriction endonuclease McrA
MTVVAVKVCNTCGVEKSVDAFHLDRKNKDGHRNRCKECAIAAAVEWQRANPDKARAKRAAWIAANPDKRREVMAASREKNAESRARYDKAWREANPEKTRARQQRYALAHPERVRARGRAYKAATRGAIVTKADRQELEEWQAIVMADPCPYTRERVACEHMDHIVPIAGGGEHKWHNLVGASASANHSKNDRSLLWYLREKREVAA